MAEYQNIFTQVQVQGPPEWGMDNENNMQEERTKSVGFATPAGWLGNAQLGQIDLGRVGVSAMATGAIWIWMGGFSFGAEGGDKPAG